MFHVLFSIFLLRYQIENGSLPVYKIHVHWRSRPPTQKIGLNWTKESRFITSNHYLWVGPGKEFTFQNADCVHCLYLVKYHYEFLWKGWIAGQITRDLEMKIKNHIENFKNMNVDISLGSFFAQSDHSRSKELLSGPNSRRFVPNNLPA